MQEILFTFDKSGKTTIEPKGIGGQACRKATAPFEQAIGGKIISDVETAEAHLATAQQTTTQQQQVSN